MYVGYIKKNIRRMLFKIKHIFISLIIRAQNLPFRNLFLKLLGLNAILPVTRQSSVAFKESCLMSCEGASTIAAPNFIGAWSQDKILESKKERVDASHFENVSVSAYSPVLASAGGLIIPELIFKNIKRVKTTELPVFRQSGDEFYAYNPNAQIENGIHIGGAGAFNWYHFIIECLPKAFLAKRLPPEFKDYPFLLPEECATIQSFSDALDAVCQGDRNYVYLKRNELLGVKSLIAFDEVSYGPFNLVQGEWPKILDYYQHDKVLKDYIDFFRKSLLNDWVPETKDKRIFLARPGVRRNYNQAALIQIVNRYGFEAVYPEQLSLINQAKLFAQSSVIIGPSGAAWVGMIFRENPMVGISWLPSVYNEFCSYSSLSNLLGHKLTFVRATPDRELLTTGDAYLSSYHVDETEFEEALKQVVESQSS